MIRVRLLVAIAATVFSCAVFAQDKVVYHFGERARDNSVVAIKKARGRK